MSVFLFGAASGGGFPPLQTWHFPSQIFWTIALFAVLYVVLSRFTLPKIGSTLETRQSKIADDLDEAGLFSKEAERMQAALDKRLATARIKAREISKKALADIERQMTDENVRADRKMAEKLKSAQSRIDDMRNKALKNIDDSATIAAQAIVQRFGVTIADAETGHIVASLSANEDKRK